MEIAFCAIAGVLAVCLLGLAGGKKVPRNDPDKFYDLVVQVAIMRPGRMVGKMMKPYMERRQGRHEIRYPHPVLESKVNFRHAFIGI